MDRLHELEVFVAVAEVGSFAKAAKKLGMSPPATTRAIAALETRLGTRLFHRTTRSLTITSSGERFVTNARRILSELNAAEKEVTGETTEVRGKLTVTASVTFGRGVVTPLIGTFLDVYPAVSVSLLLLDRVVNLIEEGLDVALRIGSLSNSSLVARKVGAVQQLLVASPGYLLERGHPKLPADLRRHSLIAFTGLTPNQQWHFGTGQGSGSVSFSPRFEVNDAAAALAATRDGQGITVALSYMVAEDIRAGRLVPVLQSFSQPPVPVHVVYAQSQLISPKLRAFVDFISPRLTERLKELGRFG